MSDIKTILDYSNIKYNQKLNRADLVKLLCINKHKLILNKIDGGIKQLVKEMSLQEKQKIEKQKTEKQNLEKQNLERQKLERQKTERQKTERQKTERQKTEIQRLERQKTEGLDTAPKYITRGSYGCVYKPIIKCQEECTDDRCTGDAVSKLMDSTEAEKEIRQTETIDNIDEKFEFHIKKPYKCTPKLMDNNIYGPKECMKFKQGSLLLYDNAGIDLFNLDYSIISPTLLLKEFIRIFKAIISLNNKSIIHQDIKTPNIVYNIEKNRLNLIDWGLMRSKGSNELYRPDLRIAYFTYPWDRMLLGYINGVLSKSTIDLCIHNYAFNDGIKLFTYPHIDPKILKTSINNEFLKILKFTPVELLELKTIILDKIDIFGLGVALQMILEKINNIWIIPKKLHTDLLNLISNMITIDVIKRITPIEALQKYTDIIHNAEDITLKKIID